MSRHVQHIPKGGDFEETWAFIQTGIDHVMSGSALTRGMDIKTYMYSYAAIHNFLCCYDSMLFPNTWKAEYSSGFQMYLRLTQYLNTHLDNVREESKKRVDESLLVFFVDEWKRYSTAAIFLNHLFGYINRHWIKRRMDEGKKDIYDVHTLHMAQWKSKMFDTVYERAMESVLNITKRQRGGEWIGFTEVRQFINSFISLGIGTAESATLGRHLYKERFEKPFCLETLAYYKQESDQFLADHTVVEYLKMAELKLEDEERRIPLYLLNELRGPLIAACEQALVGSHMDVIRNEFDSLLQNNHHKHLGRLYRLVARIPGGLDPLRDQFESHVQKAGLDAVEAACESGRDIEPETYVVVLSNVLAAYEGIVSHCFNGETEFKTSLVRVCRSFVNCNKSCVSGSSKSPELLARFTNTVLVESSAKSFDEAETECKLGRIITMFKYIEDKDIYQKFYSRMLAKRLLYTNDISEETEIRMINRLKDVCDMRFTGNLRRMIQDMHISRDLDASFKLYQHGNDTEQPTVDATFCILYAGFWPLNAPKTTFEPPSPIQDSSHQFERFYRTRYEGRRLRWLWQLCKGEIRANFEGPNGSTSYVFLVSIYQMAVLLLFNGQSVISHEEIAACTALAENVLSPSLGALVKARVLHVMPATARPSPGSSYSLNHGFKSRRLRVNLQIAIKSGQKQELEETHKANREDRRLIIQCAVVRIMKGRKKMTYTQLSAETIQQLLSSFTPTPVDIKKSIDALLENEFFERLDDEYLGYLA